MTTLREAAAPEPAPDYDTLAATYRREHTALISQAHDVLREVGRLRSRRAGDS